MTDKKRRIVRRGNREIHDDSVTPMPETEPQPAIPSMAKDNNTTDKETEKTERRKR
jgi:hypothetical protein